MSINNSMLAKQISLISSNSIYMFTNNFIQEHIRTSERVTPIEAHSQGKIIEPY